jgi:hypothetical protein
MYTSTYTVDARASAGAPPQSRIARKLLLQVQQLQSMQSQLNLNCCSLPQELTRTGNRREATSNTAYARDTANVQPENPAMQ